MSPSTLTRIAERMTVESYQPGQILTREGDKGDRVFLINVGKAEAIVGDVSRMLGTGQTFGQLAAISTSRVKETVTVKTPPQAYVLTTAGFQDVLRTDKGLADRVKLHLMGRQ